MTAAATIFFAATILAREAAPDGSTPEWAPAQFIEENVLMLGQSNFTAGRSQHRRLLVQFFAPWCGHCRHVAPEYAKAADVLAARGVAARLAKVDAIAEAALAEELGIPAVYGLGNKAEDGDREFFGQLCDEYGVALAGVVPRDDDVAAAAKQSAAVASDGAVEVRAELDRVIDAISTTVPA